MTSTRRRSATPKIVQPAESADPITYAVTVMIHVRASGMMAVTVGKRDLVTRHYRFYRLRDFRWPLPSAVRLAEALRVAMILTKEDGETAQL